MNVDARSWERSYPRKKETARTRRTSQRRILRGVYFFFCVSPFFTPFRMRSCAFRGGLAKLINVNLLT